MSDVILSMVGTGAAVALLLIGGLIGLAVSRLVWGQALTGRKPSNRQPRAVPTDTPSRFGLLGRLSGWGSSGGTGGEAAQVSTEPTAVRTVEPGADAEAKARWQELMRFLSYDGGEFSDQAASQSSDRL